MARRHLTRRLRCHVTLIRLRNFVAGFFLLRLVQVCAIRLFFEIDPELFNFKLLAEPNKHDLTVDEHL